MERRRRNPFPETVKYFDKMPIAGNGRFLRPPFSFWQARRTIRGTNFAFLLIRGDIYEASSRRFRIFLKIFPTRGGRLQTRGGRYRIYFALVPI